MPQVNVFYAGKKYFYFQFYTHVDAARKLFLCWQKIFVSLFVDDTSLINFNVLIIFEASSIR